MKLFLNVLLKVNYQTESNLPLVCKVSEPLESLTTNTFPFMSN